MKDMILFPEDIDQLNTVLAQLVTKANLLLAVLINKDGRLLTNQGSLEIVDTVSLAALIAGNSASTLAIANIMGESEFSTMYHQGKDKHIYIAVVDENTFLALVFDDRTNIDRVKVFARQFDRQLKGALEQVYNKSEDQVDLDLGMGYDTFFNGQNQPPAQEAGFIGNQTIFDQTQQPDQMKSYTESASSINTPPQAEYKGQTDEEVFFLESSKNRKPTETNDTNRLYLKNKIMESKLNKDK